ncbi:MAG: TonB-dependent receptor [Edaphobacter sp.]|uniref:TonB-dependent receptor n=1 Tax=Edaphobacter sp. TaxID=1934404 RepID=UPI0023A6864D|nr:TonB-dependent receptor [Edaphobacter sp.]MDE1175837.1 TonB-dependent receptor [Edaphobacter sp.]
MSTLLRNVGVLALVFSGTVAFAQNAQLSGLVRDSSKASIPNAAIELESTSTHVKWQARSNGEGLYLLPSLQPGVYRMTVQARGFDQQVIQGLKLEVAAKVSLEITLKVGSENQTVTVDGSGLQMNTMDASVSTVIDQKFVENIPLNGRSFQSLLSLVPGVTAVPSNGVGSGGEMTVNGQRTEANYFTVDGVSANSGAGLSTPGYGAGYSGSVAGETALGTTQSIVPIDALQEFRATTSTYSAEYGRTPGGQFSFNTRSGTNRFHGSVYDYFRNDALDANSWFNNFNGLQRTAERQNDFGGTFHGPVVIPGLYDGRDRSFFFFAYEGLRLRSPQSAITSEVPSLALRQSASTPVLQKLLNAFPLPTLNDRTDGLAHATLAYSLPSQLDNASIRGDHHFNDRFSVFGRFSTTPSSTQSRASASSGNLAQLTSSTINIKNVTLGATTLITHALANEARFGMTWNDSKSSPRIDNFGGATPLDYDSLNMPGVGPTDWVFLYLWDKYPAVRFQPQQNKQRQFNIVDSMTFSVGRHSFKWGVDYRNMLTSFPLAKTYESVGFANAAAVAASTAPSVTIYSAGITAKPEFHNLGLYVQDEWKATPRLNLSLGLRWDLNPAPTDAGGNQPYALTSTDVTTLKLAEKGVPLWKTTYNNFAPRVAFAYQASQTPGREIVVRAGYGLFYDIGSSVAAQGYWYATGITSLTTFTNVSFPLSDAQLSTISQPNTNTPYKQLMVGFDPELKLPRTQQWNVAIEQALGPRQNLTITYVGSAGSKLTTQKQYYPAKSGNSNYAASSYLYLTKNGASSNYNALQLQFQRQLSHGLQALLSYTWAHSIDDATSNFQIATQLRASSDTDISHNFQAALTYDLPTRYNSRILSSTLGGWAVDGRTFARTALPVDVISNAALADSSGIVISNHPNRVAGQPLYITDASAPNRRAINYAAYSVAYASDGTTLVEGNAGRNSARGFGAVQTDLALRREFVFTERTGLQFRVEAFNLLNHPIFGAVYNQLSYGQTGASRFGIAYNLLSNSLGGLNSLYQSGGPRSLQLAVKLHF